MASSSDVLTSADHSRDSARLTYVYPVISRRAGGVSVGVNLNPNSACNWRCIYCQVPDLTRGSAPDIDLCKLEAELRAFLAEVLHGGFMETRVPPEARRLNDIALSGNGEPTSARAFEDVVELIGRVMADFGLAGRIKLVLITNGSLIHRTTVQNGLRGMAALNGEVWFKIDSATREGMARINGTRSSPARQRENLRICAELCPTWLQTCVFALDGAPPSEQEKAAYLEFVGGLLKDKVPLRGVLLYGLARQPMQPEADRLSALPAEWMESWAEQIKATGLAVRLST